MLDGFHHTVNRIGFVYSSVGVCENGFCGRHCCGRAMFVCACELTLGLGGGGSCPLVEP